MMEMFWCCTTKEATTAVNIAKWTFQVKFLMFIPTGMVWPRKTVAIISLCTTSSIGTLYLRYQRDVFFIFDVLSFAFEELSYTFRFTTDSFKFRS